MKKTLLLFFITALSFALVSPAVAQVESNEDTTIYPNALHIAQAFAGVNIETCSGNLSFTGIVEGQTDRSLHGKFKLLKVNGKYQVTYLELVGEVITNVENGDEPRYSIPEFDGIQRNYNLHAHCREKDSDYLAAYGYFYDQVLESGEPIAITLTLADRKKFVEFSLPDDADAKCFYLISDGGTRYPYSEYDGGFNVYLNPLTVINYRIEDTCYDITYDYGTVNPLAGSSSSGGSALNINLPPGAKELFFAAGKNYLHIDREYLDGWIEADEEEFDAQSYIVDINEKQTRIDIHGILHAQVRVYAYKEKGEMPLINTSDGNCDYSDMVHCSFIPSGYNKVIILMVGDKVQSEGFSLHLNKWN